MKKFFPLLLILFTAVVRGGAPVILQPSPKNADTKISAPQYARYTPWCVGNRAQMALMVDGGATFVIPLEENGTTGYQWRVLAEQPDNTVIEMLRSDFFLPAHESGMTGVPGIRFYTFKADPAGGSAVLRFHYIRPWERDCDPALQFTLFLTVRSKDSMKK